ncbi:hypothetical protein [Mesoaciditoga lauensis]|uniref:hypothetical protein n=1 Tax=Mesoaciditoga lauensis TaxID=1495039 RepID=UPI000560659C|nr:hypothetical protein [Mesoaciditoga lauensis]
MKKVYVLMAIIILSAVASVALASGVMSFVPQDTGFVLSFTNNSQNYGALKKINVFSFLLNDLGIENLIQASVSQTAVSIGTKSSEVWKMTENDFVVFGNFSVQNLQANFAIVLKGKSKILLDLLSALVGGNTGTKNVNGYEMKTFETNGITIYIVDHDNYVLASNSPELLATSIKTYENNSASFTFPSNVVSDAWFKFYMKNNEMTKESTLDTIPVDGYGYGEVKDGMLVITGASDFEYKDKSLKAKLLSFKPNAKSLEDMPATGDFWLGIDVADPVEFYDLVKEYAKDFGLSKEDMSKFEGRELAQHFNGKVFMNASLASENTNFVATLYLSKDISEYIPEFSKDASATFTWKGHTVLRDDTVEGTKTTHTYTVFYPDKVIISDIAPEEQGTFINSSSSAKEMGSFSSFENRLWDKSFLIGYMDVGSLVKSLLQYPLTSGALFQMKFDKNANLIWQLMIK